MARHAAPDDEPVFDIEPDQPADLAADDGPKVIKEQRPGTVLRTGPWRRAPLLLFRHPAVFLSIVAATAVLAIAASSGALFLATLGSASLQSQARQDCPERSMPAFAGSVSTADQLPQARREGLAAMNAAHPLGTPYSVEIGFAQVQTLQVTLYSRAGALDHVQKLSGVGGPGVWVPDNYVKTLHVRAGDTLRTAGGKPIRVAGIYRGMAPNPFASADIPRYFCNWGDLIIRRAFTENGVGPFLISDEATVAAAADVSSVAIYQPVPLDDTSVEAADQANQRTVAAEEAFRNSGAYGFVEDSSFAAAPSATTDTLAAMISRARSSRSGVAGSIVPIDIAGVVVASLLVAGAGAYWAASRSREIRLLVTRGVGRGPLALKAVLETLPAIVVGTAAGVGVGVALVRAVAPSSVLEPGAISSSAWAAVAAVVVGVVLIAVIGAVAARDRLVGARPGWRVHVPWELLLVGLVILLGLRLRTISGVSVDKAIVHVSPLLVIFPLVGCLAVLLVLARLVALGLPRLRRSLRGGGIAFYLALRRLAGSRAISVGLIVSVALPGALLTYTSTITKSVQDEIVSKYRTNVGAERVMSTVGFGRTLGDLHGTATQVVLYQSSPRVNRYTQVVVLGIDPATFGRFALLDDDQRALLKDLHPVRAGQPAPVLMINAPSDQQGDKLTILKTSVPIEIAGRAAIFPGLRVGSQPMVVMDASALDGIDPNADRLNLVWTSDADYRAAREVLDRLDVNVLADITPNLVVDTTGLLPLTWIFDYLQALAVMIGLVAVVGLVFALAARTRQRTVSYVLSRRMGLTRIAHLRALLLELVVLVGLGYLTGNVVGSGAFGLILDSLDVYPSLPPPAAFVYPTATWLLLGGVWAAVIIGSALSVQWLADRAKPAEILRLE